MSAAGRGPARRRIIGAALGLLALALLAALTGLILLVGSGSAGASSWWPLLGFVAFAPVGAVVAIYRPANPIGWLFCVAGLINGLYMAAEGYAWAALVPAARPDPLGLTLFSICAAFQALSWTLLILSMMIFPTGAYLSWRWRIAGRMAIGYHLFVGLVSWLAQATVDRSMAVPNVLYIPWLGERIGSLLPLLQGLILIGFVPVFGSAIVRFRRARGDERQQLKWVALVAGLWLVFGIFSTTMTAFVPGPVGGVLVSAATLAVLLAVPLAVGAAILRYRLYDIDLLIRRTLVYGALTGLLAGIYFGGVAVLQTVLAPLTGAGGELAVVATTLLIAGLIQPLRRRVQTFIDQRFYRRKYDAARTLARFGATARDEVELDGLSARLISVVQETMEPAAVSLWLRGQEPVGRTYLP